MVQDSRVGDRVAARFCHTSSVDRGRRIPGGREGTPSLTLEELNDVLHRMNRKYRIVFFALSFALAAAGIALLFDDQSPLPFDVMVIVAGSLFTARALRVAARVEASGLVLRGLLRTRQVRFRRIETFGWNPDNYLRSRLYLFEQLYYCDVDGRCPDVVSIQCLRSGLRGSAGMTPVVGALNQLVAAAKRVERSSTGRCAHRGV